MSSRASSGSAQLSWRNCPSSCPLLRNSSTDWSYPQRGRMVRHYCEVADWFYCMPAFAGRSRVRRSPGRRWQRAFCWLTIHRRSRGRGGKCVRWIRCGSSRRLADGVGSGDASPDAEGRAATSSLALRRDVSAAIGWRSGDVACTRFRRMRRGGSAARLPVVHFLAVGDVPSSAVPSLVWRRFLFSRLDADRGAPDYPHDLSSLWGGFIRLDHRRGCRGRGACGARCSIVLRRQAL